jgi:RsiW-degrading membrane proteinase PrsW (M82 family)
MNGFGSQLVNILVDVIPAVALAIFGGLAEVMLRSEKDNMSVKFVLGSLVVSGFIGMIVALCLYDRNIPPAVQGAAVGIAGASARTLMEIVVKKGGSLIERISRG